MSSATSPTDRIDNIEIALAHQEQQIADLSEMVNVQRQEIGRLLRFLDMANSRIADLEAATADSGKAGQSIADIAAAEKPPHY